jgi:ABC-type nitrate/sulfonate/bicarbonate transport system substrate-binding protein
VGDAFLAFEPWATFGVKKLAGKLLSLPYDNALEAINSGIETYPAVPRAVLRAHIRAVRSYREHPDELINTGAKRYKVPEEIMREAMKTLGRLPKNLDYIDREPDWDKFRECAPARRGEARVFRPLGPV